MTRDIHSDDNGLYVTGEVAGLGIDWLIDTGCTTTIMSSKTYKMIDRDRRPELVNYGNRLRAANGQCIPVLGAAMMTIKLDSVDITHEVVVADLTSPGIIGMDFLRSCKGSINLGTDSMNIEGVSVNTYGKLSDKRCHRVTLADTVTIPAEVGRLLLE